MSDLYGRDGIYKGKQLLKESAARTFGQKAKEFPIDLFINKFYYFEYQVMEFLPNWLEAKDLKFWGRFAKIIRRDGAYESIRGMEDYVQVIAYCEMRGYVEKDEVDTPSFEEQEKRERELLAKYEKK